MTTESSPPVVLTIQEVVRAHIAETLALFRWNFSQTARALGIDRRTLYRAAKREGIKRPASQEKETSSPEGPSEE